MVGVIGAICCVLLAYAAATNTSKAGVYLNGCTDSAELFPLDDAHPAQWKSCNDAYEYTWMNDFGGFLKGMSLKNRMRLAYSMGFCPHLRCQLRTIENTGPNGLCPDGTCFSKLEHGRPSFGACCFKDGTFLHGDLIGYYHKTQPIPKPIYRRNRIVLGSDRTDTSERSFINANEVHPGIIIAQCPITGHPAGWHSTLEDTKQLIIEQNVSYILQIAPNSHDGSVPQPPEAPDASRVCRVWPVEFMLNSSSHYSRGVDLEKARKSFYPAEGRWEFEYDLWGFAQSQGAMADAPSTSAHRFCASSLVHGDPKSAIRVRHQWFYKWKDFVTPELTELGVIQSLARNASAVIKDGGKVLITCYSGRGRSGTLAAIIAGMVNQASTDDDLVRLIVTMRESRDGLVETPAQYHFVRLALGMATLSPEGDHNALMCGIWCKLIHFLDITSEIVTLFLQAWTAPVRVDLDDYDRSTKYITFTSSQTQRLIYLDYLHTALLMLTFLTAVCASVVVGYLFGRWSRKPTR